MQLLKANLNGSNPQISEMQVQEDRQDYIDETVDASGESPGYVCVAGEYLDSETHEERIISVVATSGVLLIDNFPS